MIDSIRWSQFSLFEQFGHIGSEISRARLWQERKDIAASNRCMERAFDLIDLSITDVRWQGRLKEICRFREVLGDIYSQSHIYSVSLIELDKYCANFALAARRSY
jgi:hypothetical protein